MDAENEEKTYCRYPLCINYKQDAEKYCCGSCSWRDWERLQKIRTENKKQLTIKDLKEIIEQYDRSSEYLPVVIELHMGTTYRIDKCQIIPTCDSDYLYGIVNAKTNTDTKALVLSIE